MRISKKSCNFATEMKKKEYIYPEMEVISLTGLFMDGMAGFSGGEHTGGGNGAPARTDVF